MEYDIKCADCIKCLIDPTHPDNANMDKPMRGNCTHYVNADDHPLAANMKVSYKQCSGAVRGSPQVVGEMPESGPPRSDESRDERIARLQAELKEAVEYEEPAPVAEAPKEDPNGVRLPSSQGIMDQEKEDLKRQIAELKANAKKKTGQSGKKKVKKK